MNSLTDNALMLQVKAGDVSKMGLLFERYHRELFGFLYHLSGRPDASEDLVQTVFYRLLKYRHTFTGEGTFRTWMYHVARNVLTDSVQQHQRRRMHPGDVHEYAERIGGGEEADASLQKEQELRLLEQALDRLHADQREVLVMSRYQGLKYEEIARILNTTEGAVKVRVHRAMNELKLIFLKLEHER